MDEVTRPVLLRPVQTLRKGFWTGLLRFSASCKSTCLNRTSVDCGGHIRDATRDATAYLLPWQPYTCKVFTRNENVQPFEAIVRTLRLPEFREFVRGRL
jgi:hypothetical protein